MEFQKLNLPILAHAHVPRLVKVGPVVDTSVTPWKISQHAQQR